MIDSPHKGMSIDSAVRSTMNTFTDREFLVRQARARRNLDEERFASLLSLNELDRLRILLANDRVRPTNRRKARRLKLRSALFELSQSNTQSDGWVTCHQLAHAMGISEGDAQQLALLEIDGGWATMAEYQDVFQDVKFVFATLRPSSLITEAVSILTRK